MSLGDCFKKFETELSEQLDNTGLLPDDIVKINVMKTELRGLDKEVMIKKLQALLDRDESQKDAELSNGRTYNQGGGTRRKKRGKKSRRVKRKSRR